MKTTTPGGQIGGSFPYFDDKNGALNPFKSGTTPTLTLYNDDTGAAVGDSGSTPTLVNSGQPYGWSLASGWTIGGNPPPVGNYRVDVAGTDATSRGVALKGEIFAVTASGESGATPQQVAQERYGVAGTVWHVATSGNDSNDGLSWATAFLTPVHATGAIAAGDVLTLGAGTFTYASNTPWNLAQPITVLGAGQEKTILSLTGDAFNLNLTAAGYIEIGNLTISDPTENSPFVFQNSSLTFYAHDLHVVSPYDGFAGILAYGRIERCICDSGYDAFQCQGNFDVSDSIFRAVVQNNSGPVARAFCVNDGTAGSTSTIYVKNSQFTARSGGQATYGLAFVNWANSVDAVTVFLFNVEIEADATNDNPTEGIHVDADVPANVFMFGGSIRTANGNDTDLAINNQGSGNIVLVGVTYDRTKVSNTGGGQVVDLPAGANVTQWLGSAATAYATHADANTIIGKLADITPSFTLTSETGGAACYDTVTAANNTWVTDGIDGSGHLVFPGVVNGVTWSMVWNGTAYEITGTQSGTVKTWLATGNPFQANSPVLFTNAVDGTTVHGIVTTLPVLAQSSDGTQANLNVNGNTPGTAGGLAIQAADGTVYSDVDQALQDEQANGMFPTTEQDDLPLGGGSYFGARVAQTDLAPIATEETSNAILIAVAAIATPAGTGPIPYPFQITDSKGNPLYNCAVKVYLDDDGEPGPQVAATGTLFSDQTGTVVFYLPAAGSYWFDCELAGVEFSPNPVKETVVSATRK